METKNTAEGTKMETQTVHAFEAAGLGQAPFKYVGIEFRDIAYGQAVVGPRDGGALVTTKPGGTCAYCGTYIVNMFQIKSADGRTFHVGSDCVEKVGDAGLQRVVRAAVAKLTKTRRVARETSQLEAGREFLAREDVQALLKTVTHPAAWRAAKGETMADCVAWYMEHAGMSGKLGIIKLARDAAKKAGAL